MVCDRLTKKLKSTDQSENGTSKAKRAKPAAVSSSPLASSDANHSDAVRRKVSSSICSALLLPIGDDAQVPCPLCPSPSRGGESRPITKPKLRHTALKKLANRTDDLAPRDRR